MIEATKDVLLEFDKAFEKRKEEILNTKDELEIKGTTYYVNNLGNDDNDGKTPETAWKTLKKVHEADLKEGDAVRFKRGDVFRGGFWAKQGVSYCAYGEGEKPKFYSHDKNLADKNLWTLVDEKSNIYKLNEKILDCGTLVFNGGEKHSYKHIPSYRHGKFYCRWKDGVEFDMANEMTGDLDIYWYFEENLTTRPSKGEDFPVPLLNDNSFGELFLRCEKGNPGEVFSDIEAVTRKTVVGIIDVGNVTVDNLCIKYSNFAVGGGGYNIKGIHVQNCEIGWIGGCIQTYFGDDPNFPEEKRGGVTRYGNGIELYANSEDYVIHHNYIYQVFDAGASHQGTTTGDKMIMKDIRYSDNLMENCVYSIEYFLEERAEGTESIMENIEMCGNFLRFGGFGWGQQRHNTHTPALIKGWSYSNPAKNFSIHDNIFDRCAYRLVHLVAQKEEFLPELHDNTYIQKYGMTLGQYGAKENAVPETIAFFEDAEKKVKEVFCDENAKVYYIK